MEEYICRVCGKVYDTPTWNDEFDATFDICNCCSVEFGIQDTDYDGVIEFRKDWINNGAKWFVPKMKPNNWDLEEQLKNIPKKWK